MARTHDFSRVTCHLEVSVIVPGQIEIRHFQPEVMVGDYVLLGADWDDACRYRVVAVATVGDVAYAAIERDPPPQWVAGTRISRRRGPRSLRGRCLGSAGSG